MISERPYYYDKQIKKYLVQTMAVFTGFSIEHSGERIQVPVQYGSKDRVAASIANGGTQNKPIRLPVISCHMKSIKLDNSRLKGIGSERVSRYVPLGGAIPDDVKTVHQLMPIPYTMTVDVTLYTSNIDSHWQLMEQIAILFNPSVQIQISDNHFDWQRITKVEMVGINYDEVFPSGNNRRVEQSTLSFEVPIYIGVPANVRNDIINQIKLFIGRLDPHQTDSLIDMVDFDGSEPIPTIIETNWRDSPDQSGM